MFRIRCHPEHTFLPSSTSDPILMTFKVTYLLVFCSIGIESVRGTLNRNGQNTL